MNTVSNGHAIRELNQIIGIARDGQEIYAKAVAGVQMHDPPLSALMMRMAASKTQIVAGVTRLVRDAGGQPSRHGTLPPQARRTLNGMLLQTRLCWDDMRQQLETLRERDT